MKVVGLCSVHISAIQFFLCFTGQFIDYNTWFTILTCYYHAHTQTCKTICRILTSFLKLFSCCFLILSTYLKKKIKYIGRFSWQCLSIFNLIHFAQAVPAPYNLVWIFENANSSSAHKICFVFILTSRQMFVWVSLEQYYYKVQ